MYRPTVRYADVFEDYIKGVDEATHLDRAQIFRLAMFLAVHSDEFHAILKKYLKYDATLPQALWGREEEECWLNQNYIPKPIEEKKPVMVESVRIVNKGGVKYVPKTSSPPL